MGRSGTDNTPTRGTLGQLNFVNTTGVIDVTRLSVGEAGNNANGYLLYVGGTNVIKADFLNIGTDGGQGQLTLSNNAVVTIGANSLRVGSGNSAGGQATGLVQVLPGSRVLSVYVTNSPSFAATSGNKYLVNLGDMQGANLTFALTSDDGAHFGNGVFTVTNANFVVNTSATFSPS